MNVTECIQAFKRLIPVLSADLHKGSCGRVGVIGGSLEYTGAPYFAAISALLAGVDLVHVFCSQAAGPVIKSYSPELIVHPLLDAPGGLEEMKQWLGRLHSLVIGPGLGRKPEIFETVLSLIKATNETIPIVLDADGIFLLQQRSEEFNSLANPLIITPNMAELSRMNEELLGLPNALYICKGATDKVRFREKTLAEVKEPSSLRRCGGQGDVLAGVMGAFAGWTANRTDYCVEEYVPAAVAASVLTRRCSYNAFQKYKRGMLASNLIEFLPSTFAQVFDDAV